MTEIGDRVDAFGHGSCIVLDIFSGGEGGLFGKEKWFVMLFVEKVGAVDVVPSKVLHSRNAFRAPQGKSLDDLGETVEEAKFRVWAMLQLRQKYRGDYEAGLTAAVAKLAVFDPATAKTVPIPVGIDNEIKELREMYYRGGIRNTSDLHRAIDQAFSAAMRAAEDAVRDSQET
jgi:hypothetical protein